jgi:5-formyltetrahydrofolate cyclo-ligase
MKVLSKKELRHRIRNLRRSLPTQEYQQLSRAIVENIKGLEPFKVRKNNLSLLSL